MRLQSKYNDINNIQYANNKLTEKKQKRTKERKRERKKKNSNERWL